MEIVPVLLVHGAGDIPIERVQGKIDGVKLATKLGYKKLIETGNVLDAVVEAVRSMELDPYFNAGVFLSIFSIKTNWPSRGLE